MAPNDFKGLGEKVSSDKDQSIDDGSRCRPGCWKRSHMSVTVWKRPAAHTRQWRDQVLFFSFFSLLPSGKWRCVKKFNQIDRAAWTRRKRALVPLRTHSSSAQRLTGESNARGLLLSLGKRNVFSYSSTTLFPSFHYIYIFLYSFLIYTWKCCNPGRRDSSDFPSARTIHNKTLFSGRRRRRVADGFLRKKEEIKKLCV